MSNFDKTHNPQYNADLLTQITQKQMRFKEIVSETEALFEQASQRIHPREDRKNSPSVPFFLRKDNRGDFSSFCKAFHSFGFEQDYCRGK